MKSPIEFIIEKRYDTGAGEKKSLARAGRIITPHGVIHTPAFVVVGTKATAKSLTTEMLETIGVEVVLGNTYHLYLQPGDTIIAKAGGMGKFMGWKGPTITDSGGFQVFSLGAAYGKNISKITKSGQTELLLKERQDEEAIPRLVEIDKDGVMFRSHINGDAHYFTPEKSIEIQHNLGADIIFAFDECTSPNESEHYQREALHRTHTWAKRSLDFHRSKENCERQALFGIVQGGRSEALRRESAQEIGKMSFDGFGIGGSFEKEDMSNAVRWVNEELPEDKPKHLLGIGEPEDFFMGIENGVDLFDCVLPTRNGRNGTIYTSTGKIHIENTAYQTDFRPIEETCSCYTCRNYTRAYIAHLFRAKEMLAGTLASIHNVYFLVNLVKGIRAAILNGTFEKFKREFLEKYK
ncbi:MAG: tRNA guanosine(34) transglycosylase Tgt [Candidatus Paceibacterota bacterium]|jgi:queuine tRNA-ribosyltransferase